jgi:type II secretory pathway pseudopilin PulG
MESFFKMNKSSINSTQFIVAKSQAQNALLVVALALRAYKLEHGSYPALLSQLVPDYLEQVPTDPFSLKKPLRYKLKEDAYVLYSIGPDGVDDSGSPLMMANLKTSRLRAKAILWLESIRDSVAF